MKVFLKISIILAIFGVTFYACQKETVSDRPGDKTSVTTQVGGEGSSLVITPVAEGEPNKFTNADGPPCYGLVSLGYLLYTPPSASSASTSWQIKGWTTSGANAYRLRFLVYKNGVQVSNYSYARSAKDCEYVETVANDIVLDECAGTVDVTLFKEYRIGSTWHIRETGFISFYFPGINCNER